MAKYRKKPVEIEAIQWTGNNFEDIRIFTKGMAYKSLIHDDTLIIDTLSGKHFILINYFIIKGTKDEFFDYNVCKPDSFEKIYEKVK